MMGDVVNLNRARKDRDKAANKSKAAANRAAHGRTRAEKDLAAAKAEQIARALDQARRQKAPGMPSETPED